MWTKATWAQRSLLLEELGISLYPGQLEVVRSDRRLRIVAGGERGGKSYVSAVDLLTRSPWGTEFWLIGPDYYLPRAEFEYLEQFLAQLGAVRSRRDVNKPKEGSWSLKTKSSQLFVTRTSADVRKLAARPIDGILMCEAGQQSYDTFLKAMGRVSEPRGFVLASGTFESSYDWYSTTFTEWFEDPDSEGDAFSLPTWGNTYVFPGGRQDPEILRLERLYPAGYFMEKCGAKPSPPVGVIFKGFSYLKHVSEDVIFDERLPVYLGIDPGHGGPSAYAVVACQFKVDEWFLRREQEGEPYDDPIDFCNIIDVIYLPGGDFDDVRPVVEASAWFGNVAGGAIDVEAPDERKRWLTYLDVYLASKKVPVIEGERRLQTFIHGEDPEESEDPYPVHLRIATSVRPDVLAEFRKYTSAVIGIDQMEGRPSTASRGRRGPQHFLKALWYLLYARYGAVKMLPPTKPMVRSVWRRMRDAFSRRSVRTIH